VVAKRQTITLMHQEHRKFQRKVMKFSSKKNEMKNEGDAKTNGPSCSLRNCYDG